MVPLFSQEGRTELQRLAAGDTLYAFDFDGTLAPIVAEPAHARAADRVTLPLTQLARRVLRAQRERVVRCGTAAQARRALSADS